MGVGPVLENRSFWTGRNHKTHRHRREDGRQHCRWRARVPTRREQDAPNDSSPTATALALFRGKAEEPALRGHEVDLAALRPRRTTSSAARCRRSGGWPHLAAAARIILQGPNLAGYVVGVQVQPDQFGHAFAAIHMAAGDRLADVVMVFPNRLDQVGSRCASRWGESGACPRAGSSRSCRRNDEVDLFPDVLAHVGRPRACRVCRSNASRQMLRTP